MANQGARESIERKRVLTVCLFLCRHRLDGVLVADGPRSTYVAVKGASRVSAM